MTLTEARALAEQLRGDGLVMKTRDEVSALILALCDVADAAEKMARTHQTPEMFCDARDYYASALARLRELK